MPLKKKLKIMTGKTPTKVLYAVSPKDVYNQYRWNDNGLMRYRATEPSRTPDSISTAIFILVNDETNKLITINTFISSIVISFLTPLFIKEDQRLIWTSRISDELISLNIVDKRYTICDLNDFIKRQR